MHKTWIEIREAFQRAHKDEEVRAVVVSSTARIFSAGLDLVEAFVPNEETDGPRRILISQAHCQDWVGELDCNPLGWSLYEAGVAD